MGIFEIVITIIMLPFVGLATYMMLGLLAIIILLPISLIVWCLKWLFGSKETAQEAMNRIVGLSENENFVKALSYISMIAVLAFAYTAFFTDAGNFLIRG